MAKPSSRRAGLPGDISDAFDQTAQPRLRHRLVALSAVIIASAFAATTSILVTRLARRRRRRRSTAKPEQCEPALQKRRPGDVAGKRAAAHQAERAPSVRPPQSGAAPTRRRRAGQPGTRQPSRGERSRVAWRAKADRDATEAVLGGHGARAGIAHQQRWATPRSSAGLRPRRHTISARTTPERAETSRSSLSGRSRGQPTLSVMAIYAATATGVQVSQKYSSPSAEHTSRRRPGRGVSIMWVFGLRRAATPRRSRTGPRSTSVSVTKGSPCIPSGW